MAMIDCATAIVSPLSAALFLTGQQAPRVGNDNPIAAPPDFSRPSMAR
jgi:hypothetical protein